MEWNAETKEKFELVISKMPLFHRGIAKCAVTKKSEENAVERNSVMVEEKDVVAAFFSEVPMPFYSMMIRLLEQGDFDYQKYGFPEGKGV